MGFTLRPCPAWPDAPPHTPRRGINHLAPLQGRADSSRLRHIVRAVTASLPSPAAPLVLGHPMRVALLGGELVANRLRARPRLRLILPTGHTPLGMYAVLRAHAADGSLPDRAGDALPARRVPRPGPRRRPQLPRLPRAGAARYSLRRRSRDRRHGDRRRSRVRTPPGAPRPGADRPRGARSRTRRARRIRRARLGRRGRSTARSAARDHAGRRGRGLRRGRERASRGNDRGTANPARGAGAAHARFRTSEGAGAARRCWREARGRTARRRCCAIIRASP